MENIDQVLPVLEELSRLGLSIAVDDFGTGYSSLGYLRRLPINSLKIDRSFVKDILTDTNSEIITRTIINLAHNLGLKVIAEGVESPEQLDYLSNQQCDTGQGYLFSRPMSVNQLKNYLESNYPV